MTQSSATIPFNSIQVKGTIFENSLAVLSPYVKRSGLPVIFKKQQSAMVAAAINERESYRLTITKKQIEIKYTTRRSAFYAAQTLRQVLEKARQTNTLNLMSIYDFADVPYRGIVEGFYGTPWSFEDRVSQLKFYGRWKLNAYIYGPKDDPYHSSPDWRKPYPPEAASRLQALIRIAKENEVDFYWAIHPGKDIQWNQKDSLAVLHKFELMYAIGVRHFAVFFDDISGEGAQAQKQAGLLNYIEKAFVEKKQGIGPLMMCPTEYNKLWADPKPNTYLDILGNQLDKKIKVMWTGNSVIHDITKEGQAWVNKRIKRSAFVWWNFPVNDYVRNHLLLGPVYGLDKDIQKDISGFVANPMDKAEASKVAIFSVADYLWNMDGYDNQKAWNYAIAEIFPEIASAYTIFSSHNTDPGPSYHQYRRVESENISEVVDSLIVLTPKFNSFPIALPKVNIDSVKVEFSRFAPAANDIINRAKNRHLVAEIKPWLLHFASLGRAGLSLIALLDSKTTKQAYSYFLALQKERNLLIEIDKNNNQNPYQPGVVTGSRHLLPWIEKSYFHFAQFFRENGFDVPPALDQATGQILTTIDPLKALPVRSDVLMGNKPQQELKLNPTLEVITIQPQDFIGISVSSGHFIQGVSIELIPDLKSLTLQYSEDGRSWSDKKTAKSKQVRLINLTGQPVEAKIQTFNVTLK